MNISSASGIKRIKPGSSQVANKSTLNLILGVFLKLLGFFVVMYTYTDISPLKAKQAEESLHQRFNISVSFLSDMAKNSAKLSAYPVQEEGRSFTRIRDALKTQVDFLSTKYEASSKTLVLTLPANTLLAVDGKDAQSPDFAHFLVTTLNQQNSQTMHYRLEVVAKGNDDEGLIKEISHFSQKVLAENYPEKDLTIGFNELNTDPVVEVRLTQITPGSPS